MDAKDLRTSLDLLVDKDAFAQQFYQRLFRGFPDTAQLFARTDWQQQYSSLMATLAYVVSGVEKGENLLPALHSLGKKHSSQQVKPEDYPKVGASLLATFKQILGDQFTPQMAASWTAAFGMIATEMINGAKTQA